MKNSSVFMAILAILSIFTLTSCHRENTLPTQYINGWTRVIGVGGTDTSSTKFMQARSETVGLTSAEDSKLSAILIAYSHGKYTIQVTNKQSCSVMIRWGWEGLTLDDENPSDDEVLANQTKVFVMTGDALPGRIKLKAEGDCGNSSTLIINITTQILPIEYTEAKTQRIGDRMVVNWSTETPEKVDWFYVLWSSDGKKENEILKAMIASSSTKKTYSITYPAIKATP